MYWMQSSGLPMQKRPPSSISDLDESKPRRRARYRPAPNPLVVELVIVRNLRRVVTLPNVGIANALLHFNADDTSR